MKNTLAELFDEETLSRLNFDLSLRPEQLSVEEFIELSNMLYEILGEKNKEGGR